MASNDVYVGAKVAPDTREKINWLVSIGYGRNKSEVISKLICEKYIELTRNNNNKE